MEALWTLLSVGFLVSTCQAAVLSFSAKTIKDSRYDKWLDPQRILYRFDDNSYSFHEKELILVAMSRIAGDMRKCISFQKYDADHDAGLDNIYISKTLNDGSIPPTCFTFYGRLLRAAGQGQKMAIHDGPHGCMNSLRDIMKILINVLGVRNEYNRPDRDNYIKVFPEHLQKELRNSNLLSIYNASQVDFDRLPFDYNSITFPDASEWGVENSAWYEFPANQSIPKLDHLSKSDCIGLSWMYGCDESKCIDHYNVAQAQLQDSHLELAHLQAAPVALQVSAISSEAPSSQTWSWSSSTVASTVAATTEASSSKVWSEAASTAATLAQTSSAAVVKLEASTLAQRSSAAVELQTSTAAATAKVTEAVTSIPTSSWAASTASSALHIESTVASTASTTEAVLNLTLSDVIFPRNHIIGHIDNSSSTELPIIVKVDSETLAASTSTILLESSTKAAEVATSAATTQASAVATSSSSSASVEVTTAAKVQEEPQLKLVVVVPKADVVNANLVKFDSVELVAASSTAASTVAPSSTLASTAAATSQAVATTEAVKLAILNVIPVEEVPQQKIDEAVIVAVQVKSNDTISTATVAATTAAVVSTAAAEQATTPLALLVSSSAQSEHNSTQLVL